MRLFDQQEAQHFERAQPLASRMRPEHIDEFVGQRHFLGPDKLLSRMLRADRLTSLIFYGPPGTGKTSLAQLIAGDTRREFRELNATASGVQQLRKELQRARDHVAATGLQSVLFIDELHRFSKSQQDVLLPDVESGIICLIGATTANPFFSLVAPLVSRSQIFEFHPLAAADIEQLLQRALTDPVRGLGQLQLTADPQALEFLTQICDGDARRALSALEIAALSLDASQNRVTLDVAQESIQRKAIRYDADGDDHYDAASALIKCMRASDPDSAIYWLARMLEAGEDPRFLARRIVIAAAEDVGNADPQALLVATAAAQTVEMVGMPECRIALSQAAIYVSTAPKSNSSIQAIDSALNDIKTQNILPVPVALRDSHYAGAGELKRGTGYQNPHTTGAGHSESQHLGVDRSYYRPSNRGFETEIQRRMQPKTDGDEKRNQHDRNNA
jgi:putative ATPase